ncbi:4730_t:CDS:2 [Acaulospora morrowiae]|uniref:4730_t:CDS:1 n=1 Tax=Acaulospora morrowiae TaxID=94023 RepID=A0A9N9F3B5_9GLOM|nr:4730_t:CDS:2 [Acaulospora morrowiae]
MRHTKLENFENLPTAVIDLKEAFINLINNVDDNVTEEKRKEFTNFAKSIDEGTLDEAAFKEINELSNLYIRIEEKSQQIYEILIQIDGCNPDYGKSWAPEWDKLCRKYKDLIINSKRDAATLSNYAKNLVKKVLPVLMNDKVSEKRKEKLINQIKESIKNNQEKAKKNALDFDQYMRDVLKFRVNYNSWAQDNLVKIENLKAEINKLKEEITRYDNDIHKTSFKIGSICGIAFLGISIFVAAYFAPAALLSFKYIAAGTVGTLGTFGAGYGCSYAVLKTKISGMKNELGKKEEELIMTLKASELSGQIIEPLNEFSRITKIISKIWEVIVRCLDYFLNESNYLLFLNNTPGEFESLAKYWIVLAECLDRYVAEVTKVD